MRKLPAPLGGNDGERRLGRERVVDKFVAVTAVGEREKSVTRRDRAAIDGNAGYGAWQRTLALRAHCRRHFVDGPQRARTHAACSLSAAATSS